MDIQLINSESLCKRLVCIHCCKLLSVAPIYYEESIGAICGRCTKQLQEIIEMGMLKRAHTYEIVAEHMLFPCSNKLKGCNASLGWGKVKDHESTCVIKFECPFQTCRWTGDMINMTRHILHSHKNKDKDYNGNNFIRLTSTKEFVKYDFDLVFYFLITSSQISGYENKYVVRCILVENDVQHKFYRFKIRISEKNNMSLTYEVKGDIQNLSSQIACTSTEFHLLHPSYKDYNLNIQIIKVAEVTEYHNVNTPMTKEQLIRKVISRKPNLLVPCAHVTPIRDTFILQNVLELFECPICLYYMKAPIVSCSKGHSICNECKTKLRLCPICKSDFGNARNYLSEQLAGLFIFPCKFAVFGCDKSLKLDNVNKHLKDCLYRKIECPCRISECCTEDISFMTIRDHFEAKHAPLFFKENDNLVKHLTSEGSSFYATITYKELFIVNLLYEKEQFKFDCVLVDLNKTSDQFIFKIEFDNKVDKLQFAIQQLVKNNLEDLKSGSLVIPKQFLNSYINNDFVSFKCCISKT